MLVCRLTCLGPIESRQTRAWLLRFVTHLDVDDADVAEAGEVVVRTMGALG